VNRSCSSRGTHFGALSVLVVALGACGGTPGEGFKNDHHDSGTAPQGEGGIGPDSGTPMDGGTTPDTSVSDTSTPDSPSMTDAGVDTGTITSADGFGASRTACINKINALRATDTAIALSPYTLVDTATTDSCVDEQATNDQAMGVAHYSFIHNDPSCTWGSADAWAQDECEEGYGTSVAGIEQCLQDMWDESLKPHCLGCVGCTKFGGACPDCDYSGSLGYECGHYVNMSAPYFTMVACGFAGSPPSSMTAWSAQNFE
jgi:hypothetical protein